ncbi:uncharacterized protein LOC110432416 isoform X1 [Sorghum bicolor]|uniref:uncharacterized protein LOC110432416 isoform X1 n=1 Tax=Sorghum bicolor TaxID=4558 RepID=UPI000B423E10|nr:uncharacterized protein LOC110432416 isoform X1 [Sorghum bicolor]|eukprot:XP_021308473.1 uncharacterized protein LOC110432416 isoform X1 [Sorghum bicolor]
MVNLVCANFGNDSWRFGYILVNFWSRPHPALFPVRSARGSLLFLVLVSGAGSQVRWRLSQFCYQRRALRRRACSLEQHLSLARTLLNFLQTARGHQQSVRSPSGQERPQLYSFSKQRGTCYASLLSFFTASRTTARSDGLGYIRPLAVRSNKQPTLICLSSNLVSSSVSRIPLQCADCAVLSRTTPEYMHIFF